MNKVFIYIGIAMLVLSGLFLGVTSTNVSADSEEDCIAPDVLVCDKVDMNGMQSEPIKCLCNHL